MVKIYWETSEHYKKRTGKVLRFDAPVVGYHFGYELYSVVELYEDAELWTDRCVIVDHIHGVPPDYYLDEFKKGE